MSRTGRTALAVTFFLLALYLWSYKGTSHSTDEWLFIDQMTALLQGRFEGLDVQYIGFYVLALPFMLLSRAVDDLGTFQVLCLVNSLTTAVAAGLLVLLVAELGYELEVAVITALIYGVGTLAWPYSGYFLREPAAAMWLAAAALFAVKYRNAGGWPWWIGSLLALGMAILTKRTVMVLLLPLFAYLACCLYARQDPRFLWQHWRSWSRLRRSLVGIAIGAIMAFALLSLDRLYASLALQIQGAIPNLRVLLELFASPGWGLFLFSPVLLLVVPGVGGLFRRRFLEASFLWGMTILYIFGITNHPLWWGTWNWGPRQVNPVLPLLILPLAETLRAHGSSRRFRVLLGFLALTSVLLAGMQAFVSFPFLQVAFTGGVSEGSFMWNWATSPPLTHWRFVSLENAEPVWARIGEGGLPLFLALAVLVGLSGWALLRTTAGRLRRWKLGVVGIAVLLLGLAAIVLHLAYFTTDYGRQLGFAEAAQQLRKESRPGDALVVYVWGEPPWAYIPRIALLNYCKGYCPPQTLVIKEHVIDNNPAWPAPLFQGIGNAGRVWVIMQGLLDTDSRPVETALAREWYFAGSTWTGPAVRLVRFERPLRVVNSRSEQRGDGFLDWKLLQYAVQTDASAQYNERCAYVTLNWKAETPRPAAELNTSLQLLDAAGRLVNQLDAPLSSFMPPETALGVTKGVLCLPQGSPSGAYQLNLVVYRPDTSERLPFSNGETVLPLYAGVFGPTP
jgi:hypothetical protein